MKSQKIIIAVLLIIIVLLVIVSFFGKFDTSNRDLVTVSTRGIIVDHNQENPEIGAYLQIKQLKTNEDIFVVYKPFVNMKEAECVNKIDENKIFRINGSTTVEVKGKYISEIGGKKPAYLMISTCESAGFYIKEIK